jgi:hypothetical protein
MACTLGRHWSAALTGMHLSQACSSHRRTALIGMSLIGILAYMSYRCVALTGMQLSQVCSSHRVSPRVVTCYLLAWNQGRGVSGIVIGQARGQPIIFNFAYARVKCERT